MIIKNSAIIFDHIDKITTDKFNAINEQLFFIQNLLNNLELLKLTDIEYGYLKLIAVLESGMWFIIIK